MTEPRTPFATWASAQVERIESRNAELEAENASLSALNAEMREALKRIADHDPRKPGRIEDGLLSAVDVAWAILAKDSRP